MFVAALPKTKKPYFPVVPFFAQKKSLNTGIYRVMSWKSPKHGSSFGLFAKCAIPVRIYLEFRDGIPKNGP